VRGRVIVGGFLGATPVSQPRPARYAEQRLHAWVSSMALPGCTARRSAFRPALYEPQGAAFISAGIGFAISVRIPWRTTEILRMTASRR